ncbi:MAG: phosphoglycerate mutase family protein [Pseudobutyrivibrio sp.]|nr:phosphoglycerate mutase family protein [Pseudobutyrivibrio sp.]
MDRTIYLIRHGKTKGNLEKRYIGTTDESLCGIGIEEIESRAYPAVDMVFASPMKRCIETADLIYPHMALSIIDELRETDFGQFEGKNYQDLEDDKAYEAWLETGGMGGFPGGESQQVVNIRTIVGFNKLLAESDGVKTVAAIVHGGTIMSLLSTLFGGEYYNYHVENGKGYSFDISSYGACSSLTARSFDR